MDEVSTKVFKKEIFPGSQCGKSESFLLLEFYVKQQNNNYRALNCGVFVQFFSKITVFEASISRKI